MNGLTIALLTLATWPVQAEPTRHHFDVVEVNHYFNEKGQLVFTQRAFYVWDWPSGEHLVQAWRLVKDEYDPRPDAMALKAEWDARQSELKPHLRLPFQDQYSSRTSHVFDHALGRWVVTWHDGELLRVATAESLRETFTTHDPELANRELLPKERRTELWTPKTKRAAP